MKNTKKGLLLVLCVLIGAALISCGSSGATTEGSRFGEGVLVTGDWNTYDDSESDGGSSFANFELVEEEINGVTYEVIHVTGGVTSQFQYGFAGWGIDADEESMELYRTARAFSFWILGDGRRYTIKLKTSNVTDYCYFEYTFNTEEGVAQYVEVPANFFQQPAWGMTVRRAFDLITGIEWQTHESWRVRDQETPFEIKMWNFRVHN